MIESILCVDIHGSILYLKKDKAHLVTEGGIIPYYQWGTWDLHRVDGPALEVHCGDKHWYFDGKSHRIDGAAVEFNCGDKRWYLTGRRLTFEEWKVEVRKYYNTEEDYLLMLLKL
jgi:hypothetical protein